MFVSADDKKRNWEDFTFILPCVSVGNVGQLTADLVISTLWMERVGYIYHDSILPMVGNNPFAHHDANICKLTTSCEVYENESNKLVVLQQRSPFVKGKKKKFMTWLAEWTRLQKFRQVIILTSSYSEERLDVQLQGSQFRFVPSESMDRKCGDLFRTTLGWQELERRATPTELTIDGSSQQKLLYMPGSGIAKQLFENLKMDTSVVVMMMFCSEGDNAHDAVAMVTQLNNWLRIVSLKAAPGSEVGKEATGPTEWKIPVSWRLVFGTRADRTLFH
ncbi:proteasome assembly chaperone 2-like [Haliotis rufescens]|uniref:proteasome assembly chaperone 2-like n=1 Tax=Haliotis rufescens TaxID=6454 RepID=UPI001EAFA471|nr:proteasome assembly chaperone 2-like [Haliotis rufescens]